MDEERVDSFSATDIVDTAEGPEQSEPFSPTKMFIQACPAFMAMGMSYDEYWHGSAERTRAYRDAFELRTQQSNQQMWLQGVYMIHALNATVGNMLSSKSTKITYPDEPLPLTKKDKLRQDEKARQKRFIAMKESMMRYAEQHNEKMKGVKKNE